MSRVDHEEEPFSFESLRWRQEWDQAYEDALAEGNDEPTAKQIANETVDFKRVGAEVYYGVSRDD